MKTERRVAGKNGWAKDMCPWSKTYWAWNKDGKCTCEPCKPPNRRQNMKTYETHELVEKMAPCRKTAIAHAKQINEPFRVNSLEGDYKQGKPGDYLMKGIEGELYICDKEIFEKTYEEIK